MDWRREWKALVIGLVGFAACALLPIGTRRFDAALLEAFHLVRWYAREHVILCLVPAFFIAGAIGVFVRQDSVMRYLGPRAHKALAYGVASVSGSVLAVCSCTILPLFAGIYRMGAGLGPATAFLYAGPAINVLAIILTARILGVELGAARAIGAVVFSVVLGLGMHLIFRRDELQKTARAARLPDAPPGRPLWQTALTFGALVAVLVFANWGAPEESTGLWQRIHGVKWMITGAAGIGLGAALAAWFDFGWMRAAAVALPVVILAVLVPDRPTLVFAAAILAFSIAAATDRGELHAWFESSFGFAKQILPLLFFGVLVAGALLGRPGHEGVVPSDWVGQAVGGNSLRANLFASVAGAFMYFATLTEVPILQGLIGSGMGKGPALALLLAGPALSLPNMLVIRSVLGTRRTVVFVALVIGMATVSGVLYGALF